ncbi:hypothetical protein MCOR27_008150 [Pyricularia oryzae]|uniref:Surface protein 1 n=1 Tax=Pyricularia grisea TaxID=148305 RepID=A0ABQ8NEU0_PYRGI|nr:hypothetical protein MCOR26_008408 [Pyricularia oryzae]KAI6295358.1 hypothetical protein MCOR33_007701 [Pyricularia grisea]KAI6272882.1 hypothetical protein MCOR27_008150 [Pyricularia oryzae]KAI6299162.1 hypothetical protein MCOR29_011038 [Pyricularia oryzae]KAI6348055.1 hypothetical protein MCOR28_001836 [Pyricularia oryzae]
MQFSTTTVITLLASVAAAAPVSTIAATWTVTGFKRTCNAADTVCKVEFGLNGTGCSYEVKAASLASQASVNGVTCGPYQVTSGWSGQFGPGNGFTTWSVADWSKRLIAFPSYADRDIPNGKVVSPDRSFAVQAL